MKIQESMIVIEDSIVRLIQEGKEEGYTAEFAFDSSLNEMTYEGIAYQASEMRIDHTRRLEERTNTAGIVFYRLSTRRGVKGYFVTAYGIGANKEALDFMTNVKEADAWPV